MFAWILGATGMMSLIAWIGLLALALQEKLLKRILLPLVAFSAGALLGGAFLHLLPEAVHEMGHTVWTWLWLLIGFSVFLLLEQFIAWHHCHRAPSEHKTPVTYLILIADGIHNFIGGLAIGGAFLADIRTGVITWIAAAAHEIPQELGDFGILVHGGWKKGRALLFNFISAFTVVLGGLAAYFLSRGMNTAFLLPFAAGNFIYIASSDLIPEIKHCEAVGKAAVHFAAFALGLGLLLGVHLLFGEH